MKEKLQKIAKIALILVYLVIIAGAVVRMTGSGMGCPDWPKCFGYYIPPTDAGELQWTPERSYKKGQVIIRDEALQVASKDFKTSATFNESNWEPYTKHEYTVFNPWHTWIEFINRLLGALAGLATLILAIYSFRLRKNNRKLTIFSWLVVLGMGFQAWLGATVVYSVLNPVRITLHMIMALIIVALLMYLISMTSNKVKGNAPNKHLLKLFAIALGVTTVQIVLGTQVRQFVDDQIDVFGESAKNLWLTKPTVQFYIHRSFSILVVLLNLFIAHHIYKFRLGYSKINWVLSLLLLEIITGIAMSHLDFPFGSQPLHLVIASLLFGVQYYLILEALKSQRSLKTL